MSEPLLGHAAADVPAADRPILELAAELCGLAARLAAETCRFLALLAEFDRRDGWGAYGIRSCAQWLSWRCGLGLRAAHDHLRLRAGAAGRARPPAGGRALPVLPLTRAAFAAGQLSFSKVRALTRVATPETEADLVEVAKSATAAQLERVCRGYRRAAPHLADVDVRHARRFLDYRYGDDGSLIVSARLSPEDGAVLLAALDAYPADPPAAAAGTSSAQRCAEHPAEALDRRSAEHPRVGNAAEPAPSLPERNADALVAVAEAALGAGDRDRRRWRRTPGCGAHRHPGARGGPRTAERTGRWGGAAPGDRAEIVL